ncbi:MAG: hypothetical protein SGPRY_007517 [Prymnesium sp.]
MCGVSLVLLSHDDCPPDEQPSLPPSPPDPLPPQLLQRRGPDAFRQLTLHHAPSDGFELRLTGAVLHMRGSTLTSQPLGDAQGNALLWNGEIFGGEIAVASEENDSERLLHSLQAASGAAGEEVGRGVREVMAGVHGPWAMTYWHERSRCLWYGRDALGRRSLLRAQFTLRGGWSVLLLSSVALPLDEWRKLALPPPQDDLLSPCPEWEELPADGLGCVRIGCGGRAYHEWVPRDLVRSPYATSLVAPTYERAWAMEQSENSCAAQAAAVGLLRVLSHAVRSRVQGVPAPPGEDISHAPARVGVLFSGGIDCMLLARLADLNLPPGEPIDLINVAFGDGAGQAPDRLGGTLGAQELASLSTRQFRLVCVDVSLEELQAHRGQLSSLLWPARTVMDLNIGAALWYGSRGLGYARHVHPLCTPRPSKADGCRYASCMPLPTEQTTAGGMEETQGVQLSLVWEDGVESNVIRVDISVGACVGGEHHLSTEGHVSSEGVVSSKGHMSSEGRVSSEGFVGYRSAARVLLLGTGADELMGGYGRHRTVYRQEGWNGLSSELHAERERLWLRNLGRDDRMISDWGREARHPYLDEEVMAFIARTPLPLLCNLERGFGEGDKQILRRAARLVGLSYSSYLQKRAIQFGTRIANKKVCGKAVLEDTLDLADVVHPRADASCVPRCTKDELNKKRKAWGTARAAAS